MLYFTRVKGDALPEGLVGAIDTALAEGYKPFIILYGASSSGKTYTMTELANILDLKIHSYHVICTDPVKRLDYKGVASIDKCRVPKAATGLNSTSSRAHLLIITDKCYLLDPCGNESANSLSITRADSGWKQMQTINKDLLALRRFIDAMQSTKKNKMIPYRESELTKLLYEYVLYKSLIICVGCLSGTFSDSNTLSFMQSIGYIAKPPKPQTEDTKKVINLTIDYEPYFSRIEFLQEKINALV